MCREFVDYFAMNVAGKVAASFEPARRLSVS
jgi:hypothetical protein